MDRLDAVATFVAVAEEGSFVAGARRLGRSATAVSRAVAALEDRLATRLLTRTTRAVALTEFGERYLDQARRAVAEFDRLERAGAAERAEIAGPITLTAPEMFGRLHILPVVLAYMRAYPKVEVTLLLLNRVVSFVDEGIDLGLRIAQLPDSGLVARRIGATRRVICASPDYLDRFGAPARPEDLADHQTIALIRDRATAQAWRFAGPDGPVSVQIRPRLAVNTVQAGLDAAAAGGGLIRAMCYQTEALEAEGRLVRVLAGLEPPPLPIQLVYPSGRYLPQKLRLFIDMAADALAGRFA
ncbi:LysR family transcriptional regulator [Phenylobacterium montanum]|uniref:LysR family transcriptional regulator n=1 Tax=Phenylobacterium montanum TaxID=2823693 RepID=A0A975FWE4_9CAUL|nr:LysR family transcriptional regulator [Caulobacter sp. S6]QUD86713.1 LysR family transcriptional regulator [Caulobacter sp. S6]